MGECLILKSGGGTDTSDATATKEVILSGYTAYVNDEKLVGSMTNHGDLSDNVDAGTSVDIASGYYSGGTIAANSLASQTDANATAAQILKSYTAWVKGSLITGTMTNRGTITTSLAANGTYTIPAGWHKGDGVVSQSITVADGGSFNPTTTSRIIFSSGRYAKTAVKINGNGNLKAENIKNGVKIFGVTGTWTGWVDKNIYIVQNGNLVNGAWIDTCNNNGVSLPSAGSVSSEYRIYQRFNSNQWYDMQRINFKLGNCISFTTYKTFNSVCGGLYVQCRAFYQENYGASDPGKLYVITGVTSNGKTAYDSSGYGVTTGNASSSFNNLTGWCSIVGDSSGKSYIWAATITGGSNCSCLAIKNAYIILK